MHLTRTLRLAAFAAVLLVSCLIQGTWALAATTGGIAGVVNDDKGAPIADASVIATSPSQTATATTDAQGHFVFLVLAPDTYTLTVQKTGYQTVSIAGNTVFADQTQQITVALVREIRVIATTRTVAGSLVKSGVGGDIYNVTPAQQQAAAALGGGGNLNSAYSAIASVPGLYVPTGGMGWNQAVVIHGENPWTTGFEYDGVPVNRAFDQYNSSTESSLGLEELQVYTGGGPVSVSSNGISGFINQVIKTGTYPGYATFTAGVASEAFYHSAQFEAGGSTPDRNFSYYVGISGADQAARICDQQNCASLLNPGGPFNPDIYNNVFQFVASADYGYGVTAPCVQPNTGLYDEQPASWSPGCLQYDSGVGSIGNYNTDRENIVNLHIGAPRRDGQRDDFQFLWSASAMQSFVSDDPNDVGPGAANTTLTASGVPYIAGVNYPFYSDATTYNLPFGTPVNGTTGLTGLPYQLYYQPDSPTDRSFMAALPANAEGVYHNDVGILKVQWTHPFSSNAYMRIYAYSMFTDWTEDDPNAAYMYDDGPYAPLSPNYDLITHTGGGEIAFADQINDQNLVQFNVNYITATTSRWNNTGFIDGAGGDITGCIPVSISCASSSPIGLISHNGGSFQCWSRSTMTQVPCVATNDVGGGTESSSAYANYHTGEPAITGPAALAGAQYETLWNGNASASFNSVQPQFLNANLSEEFRPNDRLVVDLAARYDNYNYILPNSDNLQNQFYAQEIQDYSCVNAATSTPLLNPLTPGVQPPPTPAFYQTCPAPYVHPDGAAGHPLFTDVSPPNYDMTYWSGRASATYTSDPDTVWRFSAGRFTEPPLTASVQYVNASGNNRSQWANFLLFGFDSPFHPIPGESSAQYDFSFEHHFRNTDWSMKITPFYESSSNWEQQFFIGAGYVTQIPVGLFRSYGVEAALQAGDFNRNGLSGILSLTYTNAAVKYQSLVGESAVLQLNTAIESYNCLTGAYYAANTAKCNHDIPNINTAGGACQYYTNGACSGATPDAILNPYYTASAQSYMDPNGWYPDPAATGSGLYFGPGYNDAEGFASPYTAALILNFRHDKWAITPSLQLEAGTKYGSPMDILGVDPVACSSTNINAPGPFVGANQGNTGAATTNNPNDCDYTYYGGGSVSPWGYLYVPNPQTGKFAQYGSYTEPNIVVGNLQATYDVSPRLRLTITAASLFHTCFGGSQEPWTTATAPGQYVCGYGANTVDYVGGPNGGGAYVGSSPTDTAANGVSPDAWEMQSYLPSGTNGAGGYLPFNLYIQAQIHL